MPTYGFTMGFRQLGRTASETWYHDANDLDAAGALGKDLCAKRNAMLFTTTEWVGVRIGLATTRRAAQLYSPGDYTKAADGITLTVPGRGVLLPNLNGEAVDQPNACIQTVVRFDANRSTKRYLAFVPDVVLSGEPGGVSLVKNQAFSDAYAAFRNFITNKGWKIRARMNTGDGAPKPIQKWVRAAADPADLGVVLTLATAPAYEVGDKIQIQGVRLKGTDKTSYNMIYRASGVVDSAGNGTRTVYLGLSGGGDPNSVRVLGSATKVLYSFFEVGAWSWFRAGTHKRGGSFGAARGRSKRRVLLDP